MKLVSPKDLETLFISTLFTIDNIHINIIYSMKVPTLFMCLHVIYFFHSTSTHYAPEM